MPRQGPGCAFLRSVVHSIAYSDVKWTLGVKIIRARPHNNLKIKLPGPTKFNKSIAFRELQGIRLLINKNVDTLMVSALGGRRDERHPQILHCY